SSRRRHTRCYRDWSSDVCSSDLISTRPTGVNLRWAVERVFKASSRARLVVLLGDELRREADMILREELEAAHKIGRFGAALIEEIGRVSCRERMCVTEVE